MSLRPLTQATAALVALMLAGCGQAGGFAALQAPTQKTAVVQGKKADHPAAPATKEAFLSAVKAKGLKLSEADLAVIQAERVVKPSGLWAPRPAENLTAQQNLDVHQKKHGHEFRPALTTSEAYIKQGNAAGAGERGEVRFFFDTTSFQKGYQSHVVRWVPKTNDFTAFRADGAQTTYYQSVPKAGRFIEVPVW
jgi:hypothetical protein